MIENIEQLAARTQEILETITCHTGLEDEILKLFCLFSCCLCQKNERGENILNQSYVIEKTSRLLQGIPIILDNQGKKMFVRLKLKQEMGLPPQNEE